MSKEKYRARAHMIQLYTDNKEHMEALEKIKLGYDHIGILHNKDYFTKEDEKKNPEHVAGSLKKEHYHIIVRFNQAIWSSAICSTIGIDHKWIEQVRNFDNALQYLIHYNDSDKAQYSIDDCFGNLKPKLTESINKLTKSEGEKVVELIEYIEDFDGYITIKDFSSWCAKNGYWAEFRRSASIFLKIIEEHNKKYNTKNYA